jgi:ABC-type transport system substrate-binding protein
MVFIGGAYPSFDTFLQVFQSDLAQIGVSLNLVALETAPWLAQINGGTFNGLYYSNDNYANTWPSSLLNTSPGWKPDMPNNSGQNFPEWKSLVESASTETDPSKQKAVYDQINDFILDQSWVMPVGSNPVMLLGRNVVQGVVPTMHQGFLFGDTWLSA